MNTVVDATVTNAEAAPPAAGVPPVAGGGRAGDVALDDFFSEAPLGLLWVAPDGRVERVNRACLQLVDGRPEEFLGQRIVGAFARPERAEQLLLWLRTHATVKDFRARLRRKDGRLVHVLIDAIALWHHGALGHSHWFVRDVTRAVELEREVLAISDQERRRLGHELHDDLCQQLSGVQFLSETLASRLAETSSADAVRAQEIAGLLRESIEHARELAHGLSPLNLENDELRASLRGLTARTRRIFRCDCRLSCDRSFTVGDHIVSANLYRIAQEAVNNAIRHGKARAIEIKLTRDAGRALLAIIDNGVGLPANLRKRRGVGLRVMQYRANSIYATLTVQRRPQGGTEVICEFGDRV